MRDHLGIGAAVDLRLSDPLYRFVVTDGSLFWRRGSDECPAAWFLVMLTDRRHLARTFATAREAYHAARNQEPLQSFHAKRFLA